MAKYCSDCSNLDTKKKKAGKIRGNLYYCKKLKQYVNTTMYACEKFDKTYSRKKYENDEIYDDGKKFLDDDNTPVGLLVAVFFILLILGLIMGVFQ